MENVRTFIAITLPSGIRTRMATVEEDLRRTGADFKWVEPENLHLTVKFLGGVPADRLAAVFLALQKAAAEIEPFHITLAGVGAFPNLSHPRVIWVGASEGVKEATQLWRRVEDAMFELGFPPDDRPFTLHLTLGRERSPGRSRFLQQTAEKWVGYEFGRFEVASLTVFRSDLRPTGPVYTPLSTAAFERGYKS